MTGAWNSRLRHSLRCQRPVSEHMLETGGVLGSWFQAGSSPDCCDHLESKHIEISLSFPPLPPPGHIAFQIFLKMVVKGDECLTRQAGGFLSDVPLLRQAPIPCVMRALCSWGEAVSVCSVSRWWLQFGPMCLCLSHVKGGGGSSVSRHSFQPQAFGTNSEIHFITLPSSP